MHALFILFLLFSFASFGQTTHHVSVEIQSPCTVMNVEDVVVPIKVYPNPVNDYLILNLSPHEHAVQILDFTGKSVQAISGIEDQRLDISQLKRGMYLMLLYDESKKRYSTYKFQKL